MNAHTPTLSAFIAASSIPAPLIRAVVRNMGGWDEFKDHAQHVTNHGADAGFGRFVYYSDTCKFFKRQRANIITLASTMADDLGKDMLAMIAGFNCLHHEYTVDEVARAIYQGKGELVTQIKNTMAWFALEEVCRAYCDWQEVQP